MNAQSKLQRIDNKFRNRDYQVNMRFPEFTCLCPMTSQPDFAEIIIEYIPGDFLVELKSMKLYLNSFRDKGIFHEEAINRIMDDFVDAIKPRKAEITGNFHVRGGIYTTVKCSHP
jgi:7-cyano-7-deazaguanine reductase